MTVKMLWQTESCFSWSSSQTS